MGWLIIANIVLIKMLDFSTLLFSATKFINPLYSGFVMHSSFIIYNKFYSSSADQTISLGNLFFCCFGYSSGSGTGQRMTPLICSARFENSTSSNISGQHTITTSLIYLPSFRNLLSQFTLANKRIRQININFISFTLKLWFEPGMIEIILLLLSLGFSDFRVDQLVILLYFHSVTSIVCGYRLQKKRQSAIVAIGSLKLCPRYRSVQVCIAYQHPEHIPAS